MSGSDQVENLHRLAASWKIAVIVPAVLRHDQRPAEMAGGSDMSGSTARAVAMASKFSS